MKNRKLIERSDKKFIECANQSNKLTRQMAKKDNFLIKPERNDDESVDHTRHTHELDTHT